MRRLTSMFNPPTVQAGEDACYGDADPIEKFGDTPETEQLIERPDVQKKLLKAEVPYQCRRCKHIFFVERSLLMILARSRYLDGSGAVKLPQALKCIRSHYVMEGEDRPPYIIRLAK